MPLNPEVNKWGFKKNNLRRLVAVSSSHSLSATTSCKIVETLSFKNTFSSFQYPPYLEFKPFPLPFPSPPFNVDCLSLQQFSCLASNSDKRRGGGGGWVAAVWEIIGKLITPQEGEVSPPFLQLVVALKPRTTWNPTWKNHYLTRNGYKITEKSKRIRRFRKGIKSTVMPVPVSEPHQPSTIFSFCCPYNTGSHPPWSESSTVTKFYRASSSFFSPRQNLQPFCLLFLAIAFSESKKVFLCILTLFLGSAELLHQVVTHLSGIFSQQL